MEDNKEQRQKNTMEDSEYRTSSPVTVVDTADTYSSSADVRLSPSSPTSSPPGTPPSLRSDNATTSTTTTSSSKPTEEVVETTPSTVGQVSLESFYDHSPGEVYTIPEEEDEAGSPTSGDGVTSLRKRRLVGGESSIRRHIKKIKKIKHCHSHGHRHCHRNCTATMICYIIEPLITIKHILNIFSKRSIQIPLSLTITSLVNKNYHYID